MSKELLAKVTFYSANLFTGQVFSLNQEDVIAADSDAERGLATVPVNTGMSSLFNSDTSDVVYVYLYHAGEQGDPDADPVVDPDPDIYLYTDEAGTTQIMSLSPGEWTFLKYDQGGEGNLYFRANDADITTELEYITIKG